jgi:uncharacterized paraquat-inducible protein A
VTIPKTFIRSPKERSDMTSDLHYRICPECRTEYTRFAERCADCDVDLVHGDTLAAQEADAAAFPPAAELECVRVAPIAWIHALSEALQEHGVAHRVEPASAEDAPDRQRPEVFGGVELFGLYVRSEHAAPTREIDGSIAAQVLPDEAPALEDGEVETCPACSATLSADETECPDCGLRLG